jgi:V8-like Glu-specific endopeptidase
MHAQAAIFGGDDRINITPSSSAYALSRSTAVAILSSNVKTNAKGLLDLSPDYLSDQMCTDEKFATDPSLSYACTGFLVAPDLLMTAGHCMVNVGQSREQKKAYCEVYSWLFDYDHDEKGQVQVTDISPSRLYECKEVVYAIREEKAPFRDFSIVQLKRSADDRPFLKLAKRPVRLGESVSMIGYPLGMPAKVSTNARVTLNSTDKQSFVTNLDALDGNSGSPVFNSDNEVAGILVGGTPIELFKTDKNGCIRYNTCDADGMNCAVPDKNTLPEFQKTGSIVQRIQPVAEMLDQIIFKSATKSFASLSLGVCEPYSQSM